LARETVNEIKKQSAANDIARQALGKSGFIFVTKDSKETESITNRLAAEHVTIDSEKDLTWILHAGSIFIGSQTPQSMGDYVSGPNHVLPTGRLASVRGGLSVYDFLRLVTTQKYTSHGLAQLGPHAVRLAEAEGLVGHAASVRIRSKAGKVDGISLRGVAR
jgi:histidinol dehydrogenase